jgi:hypothetical protein
MIRGLPVCIPCLMYAEARSSQLNLYKVKVPQQASTQAVPVRSLSPSGAQVGGLQLITGAQMSGTQALGLEDHSARGE